MQTNRLKGGIMIHSRKKGAHIGWMLLLLLVLSMGIASVQASAAPVSTAAKSADGKIVTKGSDKYYRYKDGSYAKIHGLRSASGRTIF